MSYLLVKQCNEGATEGEQRMNDDWLTEPWERDQERDQDIGGKAGEMGGQGSFMIRPDSYLTMRPAQRAYTELRKGPPDLVGRKSRLGRYALAR